MDSGITEAVEVTAAVVKVVVVTVLRCELLLQCWPQKPQLSVSGLLEVAHQYRVSPPPGACQKSVHSVKVRL